MTWLQLRVDAQRPEIAEWDDALLASGAVAVTLEDNADQPLLEPGVGETPMWNLTRITGLYPADTDMKRVMQDLPEHLLQTSNPRVEILEDKDWEREWMQHYQPMHFGERLWVCPSWLEPPDPNAVNLMLDPGLAFGTGTHPTTALCLTQLDSLALSGQTIVDYGCGSGILAVAALKLGAARALGVDNDPQALAACRDNATRNNIAAQQLTVAFPQDVDQQTWSQQAELVIANILAGPLIELSATLLDFLQPGGTLLLSGLLQNQAEALCEHYADRLPIAIVGEKDGWVCLRGTLPPR
ncbi:MAG: 50S ribosomal protein L11 methyltransferase [Halioglobus sp.]|nr:50S ribosomal protein L11 methyltransferase [Halioglobus sp.]